MRDTFEIRRATPGDAETVAVLFDAYRQFYRREPDLAEHARSSANGWSGPSP